MRSFLPLLAAIAACSGNADKPAVTPPPADAAPAPIDGITAIGSYDPASGAHLDDDPTPSGSSAHPAPPKRAGRPIEITLRSSPPGATAFVDNVSLGSTPAFWMGEANGREHTFTFTLRGHGTAVYRFVPVASGVVHARLEATTADDGAAGSATAPRIETPPSKVEVPAPPPTVVHVPVDAAAPAVDAAVPVDVAPVD